MDGAMTKAPLGKKRWAWGAEAIEQATAPNPTDRGKSGSKRSVLTDGAGIPLAVAIAGANRNDCKLVEATLSKLMIGRLRPTCLPASARSPCAWTLGTMGTLRITKL